MPACAVRLLNVLSGGLFMKNVNLENENMHTIVLDPWFISMHSHTCSQKIDTSVMMSFQYQPIVADSFRNLLHFFVRMCRHWKNWSKTDWGEKENLKGMLGEALLIRIPKSMVECFGIHEKNAFLQARNKPNAQC